MRLDCLAPFPLRSATLPLTGENHPLRREFNKWMSWGNASTLLLTSLALCTFLAFQKPPVVSAPVDLGPDIEWVQDPTIEIKPGPKTPSGPQSEIGIIEPTAQLDLDTFPFPAIKDIPGTGDLGSIVKGKEGERILGHPDESALPPPDAFVAVEVYPEKLRMDAPIYPQLAREAAVEGTVVLRILVSKEGKVLDCIVMSGNPMLVDAAVTAARTAVFSPALQAHKPVAVWVQLPIVFSLK